MKDVQERTRYGCLLCRDRNLDPMSSLLGLAVVAARWTASCITPRLTIGRRYGGQNRKSEIRLQWPDFDLPTNSSMASSSNIWTPSLEKEFYQSVAELRKRTDIPSEVQDYRNLVAPEPHGHVLSFRDELQIADGLAFLSHCDEGVDRVSAVTLQEHAGGLTVLLASNRTPDASIIRSLEKIFTIVTYYIPRRSSHQSGVGKKLANPALIRRRGPSLHPRNLQ